MIAMDLDQLDRQRERWRRARAAMNLVDPFDPNFATGGLATNIPGLTFRVVVLPADPEAHLFDFDDEFWKAWQTANLKRSVRIGGSTRPTSSAAVCMDDDGQGKWQRYIAVHHSGALELAAGDDVGWHPGPTEGNTRAQPGQFQLGEIFERIRIAVDIIAAEEPLKVTFPLEVSVALKGTKDTYLSGLAPGWRQSGYGLRGFPLCIEPNVLIRREVFAATDQWADELLESFGAQVENTFGTIYRRFRPPPKQN